MSSLNRARWPLVAGCAVAALLVALSPSFGRAHPDGSYRPVLAPDALALGCYPLPAGVRLDFPHQVRSDEDLVGTRTRRLVVQYDLVDAQQVRTALDSSFRSAGFTRVGTGLVYRRAGFGQVDLSVEPIPGGRADDVVRGTVRFTMPTVDQASSSPECSNRFATKRFAREELTP
ncbi:MAG: hypothetical protein ACJ72D_22570 [Marmoricola sp.]